jgi:hypothetical protein
VKSTHKIGTSADMLRVYQEALLSKCRLYFTDKQAYFESSKGVRSELVQPLTQYQCRVDHNYWIHASQSWAASPRNISRCIYSYTDRSLTNPDDILQAILGIMAYFERVHNIRHIWGMPFTSHVPVPSAKSPLNCLSFEESLSWKAYGRAYHINRRPNFPSWSWTGWNYCMPLIEHVSADDPCSIIVNCGFDIQVWVEFASGQLLSWPEFNQRYVSLNTHVTDFSHFLHLRAATSSLERTYEKTYGRSYLVMPTAVMIVLACQDRTEIALRIDDYEMKTCSEALRSYPLESFLVLHLKLPNHCMILIRNLGDHWERVGMLLPETTAVSNFTKQVICASERAFRLG